MPTKPASQTQTSTNLVLAFAETQMSPFVRQQIEESTFLELATCAYFCGAEMQLRKQSKLNWRASHASLIVVVMDVCDISKSKTIALINTINRLSKRYHLMESIVDQGKKAADQWLNCEEMDSPPLIELVKKYKNLTMFDLGIEGINDTYEEQQQKLYSSLDQSVGKLRRRGLVSVLIMISLFAAYFIAKYHLNLI